MVTGPPPPSGSAGAPLLPSRRDEETEAQGGGATGLRVDTAPSSPGPDLNPGLPAALALCLSLACPCAQPHAGTSLGVGGLDRPAASAQASPILPGPVPWTPPTSGPDLPGVCHTVWGYVHGRRVQKCSRWANERR